MYITVDTLVPGANNFSYNYTKLNKNYIHMTITNIIQRH